MSREIEDHRTYLHDLGLANAMSTCDGLEIVLRIPVSVDHDDMRSASEVDTKPASFGRHQVDRIS